MGANRGHSDGLYLLIFPFHDTRPPAYAGGRYFLISIARNLSAAGGAVLL